MDERSIETLNEIKPMLRSLAAFAIYLRYGLEPNVAYARADVFLKQLDQDVKGKARSAK
jgi:hypothetical protein